MSTPAVQPRLYKIITLFDAIKGNTHGGKAQRLFFFDTFYATFCLLKICQIFKILIIS